MVEMASTSAHETGGRKPSRHDTVYYGTDTQTDPVLDDYDALGRRNRRKL